MLFAPQRVLLDTYDREVKENGRPNETQKVRVEGEILTWSAANEKTLAGRGDTPWSYPAAPFWIILFAVPIVWIVTAAVLRGGLSMVLTGITVMRSDGRRGTRRQCAFRAALVWLPPAILLAASVWVQLSHFEMPYLAAGLWVAAAILMPVYLVLALKYPSRPPQDRLAGTHLVPL